MMRRLWELGAFGDPTTRSPVWRAIARAEKSNAAQIEAKLDDMVKKSFEKYPPKPKRP